MIHKRHILLLFIFILVGTAAQSQFARFRHITVEDGLTQNYVSCFVQDKKGFIWIGTNDGLNKYDGKKLYTFRSNVDDSSTIVHNSIRCLYADNEDNLWGGTGGGGMFKIELKTLKVTNYFPDSLKPNALHNGYVNAIIEAGPGKLYIATFDGLSVLDKKTGVFTLYKNGGKNHVPFLSNNLRYMTADHEGHLWCSNPGKGVTEYDPKTGQCEYYNSTSKLQLRSTSPKALFCDSKNRIWLSCWANGSVIIDKKNNKIFYPFDSTHAFKELEEAALVSQFYEDRKGNIWFATAERGLGKFDAIDLHATLFENNKDDPETINDNTTFAILEDKSGLMWCGTWKGGANVFDPRVLDFGYYKHENNKSNSLNNNTIFTIRPKSGTEVLIGTNAGVSIFDSKTKKITALPIDETKGSSMRHNTIALSVHQDDDGSIWIGSFGAGIYRYYPEKNAYKLYEPSADTNSFSHHSATQILKDKINRLWFATEKGLNVYNREKDNFSRVQTAGQVDGLSSNYITALTADPNGKFWIGTLANGLNFFDPVTRKAKLIKDDKKHFQADVGITTLMVDSKGVLWIGSAIGLFSREPKSGEITSYTHLDPVFASQIPSIQEDNTGFIWVSNSQGICKLNPLTKEFTLFRTSHGIQGRQFSLDAACSLPNGYLFFGGMNGFNAFNPSDITLNTIPPNVVLTDFSVLNKPYKLPLNVSYTDDITLSYKNYFFELDFAALDFTDPSKNQYAYKLEGFNESWVNIGNEQKVTFTNLDPGTYTLLIKASNNDGVWGEPLKVRLSITPPFWRTTWFYVVCIVVIGLLIYGYIRFREKKLMEEKTILENKVKERTSELEIEKQKVEDAHKDIKDSINYARRIQQAQMPTIKYIEKKLKDLKK